MNLQVWGLGYAGLVCAAGLAGRGHRVVGVDIDARKIASLSAGEIYFREPGLAERVASVVAEKSFRAVTPDDLGTEDCDASILCLSTPGGHGGELSTRDVLIAAGEIAERLRTASRFHTVIVRSTVPVHFTRNELRPLLETKSGKMAGRDFGLAMVPEFLREGHAFADFDHPSLVVLGADDVASADAIRTLFGKEECPVFSVPTGTAELFKLTNNAFHALKIAFANEVARLAHHTDIDGTAILQLLCADKLLNTSPAYLSPGFAFGGACLEKDLAALLALETPTASPLLSAIAVSNRAHLDACARAIRSRTYRRLGLYGVTNKVGSDDLRNSPVLALLDLLAPAPGTVCLCDPDLDATQGEWLRARYEVRLVDGLDALQRDADLIVNFRHAPLELPKTVAQLHFASFWDGRTPK
jgi:GDP-mannose 6-dehydrogenase